MIETIQIPALGALRFVDVETRDSVTTRLRVSGSGVRVIRNASGLYVITRIATEPATLELQVSDPSGWYMERRLSVEMPRQGEALFSPLDVLMYPSPRARSACGSTMVRCSVSDGQGAACAGVLLRVSVDYPGATAVGRGLSDVRGEALVLVPGVPAARWGDDPSPATIHAAFDAHAEWPPNPDALEALLSQVTIDPLQLMSGCEHKLRLMLA